MGLVGHPPAAYTGGDMAPLSALTAALMKFGEQYKDKKRATEDSGLSDKQE